MIDFDRKRQEFNALVETWKVSPQVKKTIQQIDRRDFMPLNVSEDRSRLVYTDTAIQLSATSSMSQPSLVAHMTDCLDLRPGQKVLELGTASGYQAAIIQELVEDGSVDSIEYDFILAYSAKFRLWKKGYRRIAVHHGDGLLGKPELAPFDRIIVTAAARTIPETLVDQLVTGGIFVGPVGPDPSNLEMTRATKMDNGELMKEVISRCTFHPLRGSSEGAFSDEYLKTLQTVKQTLSIASLVKKELLERIKSKTDPELGEY